MDLLVVLKGTIHFYSSKTKENKEFNKVEAGNKASSSSVLATGSGGILQLVSLTNRNSTLEVHTTAVIDT